MSYKNYNIVERSKFSSKFVEINKTEYLKIEYKIIKNNKKCILWIPGRNDYFYHYHFSSYFNDYDIYAVMFRNNHSRRLDVIHHIDDITEYFLEIDQIYDKYNINNYDEVILYGHSTGGLISILYQQNNKKNKISKLILNSPFLKFKRHWIENMFLNYIGWYLFNYIPAIDISFTTNKQNCFTIYLSQQFKINKKYKKYYEVPVISSWLINVIKYQYQITMNEIKINIPTIILFCDKSIKNNFTEKGDSVINIKENLKQVPKLFDDGLKNNLLTLKIIKYGVHDLLCSSGDINNINDPIGKVFSYIDNFLNTII